MSVENTKKKGKTELLNLIILFTCLLEIFPNQYLLFNLMTSGLLCFYWFLNKSNKLQLIDVFLIMFVLLQIVGAFALDRISIFVFFLFLETQELYSKKSIKTATVIMVFFFVVVVMAYYFLGFNESFDLTSWDRVNNCYILQKGLGFTNANRCMLYLFCTSLLILLSTNKIIVYGFVLGINYVIYSETQSRTFFYAIIAVIALLLLLKMFKAEDKKTIIGKLAPMAFLVAFALSVILPLYFSNTVLNDLFTGRLAHNKEFLNYGLSLFGNSALEEMTFDSSYLHMLLTKGVLYTLMYSYLILRKKRALTNKDSVVLVSLFAVSFMEVIFLKYMVMIVIGYIYNRENTENAN